MGFSEYVSPEWAVDLLASVHLTLHGTRPGDISPEHVRYGFTLSAGSKEYGGWFESNPNVHGEPTLTQVVSSLAADAALMENGSIDEFFDMAADGERPSVTLAKYETLKGECAWLREGLGLSDSGILLLAETLDEQEAEVDGMVVKIQSERAERQARENPPAPEGFVTIDDLCASLDLDDTAEEASEWVLDNNPADVIESFQEVAGSQVDIMNGDLLEWLPDNAEWLEEADAQGLLECCHGDLYKMIAAAQYECFSQHLYDHKADICTHAALQDLKGDVYAVSQEAGEQLLDELGSLDSDDFFDYREAATTVVEEGVRGSLGERLDIDPAYYGGRTPTEYINPFALNKEAAFVVNDMGYDAAFEECWNKEWTDPETRGCEERPASLSSVAKESRAAAEELSQGGPHDAPGHDGR